MSAWGRADFAPILHQSLIVGLQVEESISQIYIPVSYFLFSYDHDASSLQYVTPPCQPYYYILGDVLKLGC